VAGERIGSRNAGHLRARAIAKTQHLSPKANATERTISTHEASPIHRRVARERKSIRSPDARAPAGGIPQAFEASYTVVPDSRVSEVSDVILAITHQENAGPGYFTSVVSSEGFQLEVASYAASRPPKLPLPDYAAVAVFGGTPQVDEEHLYPWLIEEKRAITKGLESGVPLLGICLGAQLMAESAGGAVGPTDPVRFGWGEVTLNDVAAEDPLFGGLPPILETVVWHKYEIALPSGAVALAVSSSVLQAFRMKDQPAWGIQFHPEQSPEQVAVWLALWLREGYLDEGEVRRQEFRGEELRGQQEHLARHLFRRFLTVARERP
jgi:GMP synthase (glutamine-hydrolysing)